MAKIPNKIRDRALELWPSLRTTQGYEPPENHGDPYWYLAVAIAYEEDGKLTQARTYAQLACASCQLNLREVE